MSLLFILVAHLLVTLARLARPGGVRAVAAESLAVKHLLLIMNRSRLRSPNLTPWDRVILGFCTLLVSPRRLGRIAVILKTSTLLRLQQVLVKRKYRLLYNSGPRRRPGPKGPSRELIDAVVEMKRRNPYFGYRKIAEQIFSAFGIALKKHVVRRILVRHYPPEPDGGGPFLARGYGTRQGPLVERRSLPRRINPAQESLDFGGDGRLHPADPRFRCRHGQSRRHPSLPDVQLGDRQADHA